MEKLDWKELAARIFCFSALAVILFLFFKYVFVVFIPFLIAWAIALPLYPLACSFSARTKISRRLCSVLFLTVALALIITIISLIASKMIDELVRFSNTLLNDGDKIILYFRNLINSVTELPFFKKLESNGLEEKALEAINELITKMRDVLISKFGEAIPSIAIFTAKKLPSALFVTIVTFIACFYFSMDVDLVHKFIKSYLPSKAQEYIAFFKKRIFSALKKYLKAYIIIFVITFFELLAGFLILKVNYAFVLAFVVAIVDILPVFGTGTVLIPWSLVSILSKNYYLGFGLLILYVIMTVARQAFEPKIVGKSMGIHPLITLVGMYLGFSLFGVTGLIFAPMLLTVLLAKSENQ